MAKRAAEAIKCVSILGLTRRSRPTASSVDCVICGDSFDATSTTFQAPCSHNFCHKCVIEMVEMGSRDEQLLPLRCCKILLPVDPLLRLVSPMQRATFQAKLTEASVPPPQRVYCANKSCSAFLGEAPKCTGLPLELICPKCNTGVCTGCKNTVHPGDDCKQNTFALQVRNLAAKNQWQTCPGCKMIVQRNGGCLHMSCRCGVQFCYCCGSRGSCHRQS
ncbi:hypothetical protein J3A83DRAFT_4097079 [Scleroderma citrinum]